MRKETRLIAEAFKEGRKRTMARTSTDGDNVWLHGKRIAWREGKTIYMTAAGYPTRTTVERINGIIQTLGVPLHRWRLSKRKLLVGVVEIEPKAVIGFPEEYPIEVADPGKTTGRFRAKISDEWLRGASRDEIIEMTDKLKTRLLLRKMEMMRGSK